MAKSTSRHLKSSKYLVFGYYWPSWLSWWWPKFLKRLPEYSHGPKDSKTVSYVGLQWWNSHQDTQNPPNTQFLDFLDPPDHPDGDQNSWKHFLSTPMVLRIPKQYHMWGYNGEIPIKTPKILQIPSFWTFLTLLIILMVTKIPENTSWVLPWS